MEKSQKTTIILECTIEQRELIRIMAAQESKSTSDFILSLVEKKKARKMLWSTPPAS